MSNAAIERWLPRLRAFVPTFVANTRPLASVIEGASIVLHGSTTFGVDDAASDLDLWVLLDEAVLTHLGTWSNDRFFEFKLNGKAGHFTLHTREEFASRLGRCDFPLIAELRTALALQDPSGSAALLIRRAKAPMPEAVRQAWFAYHYIEMRSEHRACDNPIDRGDAPALLLAMSASVAHALRAAIVLDGEPYPYVKWLAAAAAHTPTGARVAKLVDELLDLLAAGALRMPGPERQHPINLKLREIRNLLIAAARSRGIDGPWLEHWYLHLDMRQRIGEARWDAE